MTSYSFTSRATWVGRAAGLAVLLAALIAYRLSTATLTNDDYLHVSTAQQVVLGAMPVRDFLDPGELLFYSTSAAAQALFGRSMLSEVLLDAVLLSIGQLVVFVLASRAARSTAVGLVAAAFPVVIVARLYSYPKTLLYAVALLLMWRYLDTRRRGVLWALSLWTGVAFLFRHDHGAYIGVTAAVMLAIAHAPDARALLRSFAQFCAPVALMLLPFLAFVQLNAGIPFYVRQSIDTARGEYLRTAGPAPELRLAWAGPLPLPAPAPPGQFDPNVTAWLYDVTVALPPLVLLFVSLDWARHRRGEAIAAGWRGMDHESAKLVCAVVLGALMHTYLLRAKSDSAIADVSALTGVLGAWLLGRALWAGWHGAHRLRNAPRAWTGACAGLAAVALAIGACLVTVRYLRATPGGDQAETFVRRLKQGMNPLAERVEYLRALQAPYDHDGARYLFACTAETDRVLISSGYRPELYYAAGRGFAAGRVYYLNSLAPSPEFKAYSLERLREERVPIALVDRGDPEFAKAFAPLQQYLRQHYRVAGRVDFWDDHYDVLVDARIPPTGTWADRLPCYR
jgi:hypothetical protein